MILRREGFTLIELLIVVAIIAILAAIAVPNFLEAQMRAKISRIKSDMRTVATGLETYAIDNNKHPIDTTERIRGGVPSGQCWEFGTLEIFNPLTTPIAYITGASTSRDIFQDHAAFNANLPGTRGHFLYVNYWPPNVASASNSGQTLTREGVSFYWILSSLGPDKQSSALNLRRPIDFWPITASYDPTNGTVSLGDIPRY
jgi:prepilin-type N-terminal cleavage/methylation domain-containing protein